MYVHVHTIHTPSFHLPHAGLLTPYFQRKKVNEGGKGMKFFSLDGFILLLFFWFFLRSYIVMCDTLVYVHTEYLLLYIRFMGQKEKTQQRVCFVTKYGYIDKEAEVHTSFHL